MAVLSTAEREALLHRAIVIRDEIMHKANTANRVGSLFYDIVRSLAAMDLDELRQYFLRKDVDDETIYKLTMAEALIRGSLEVGDDAVVQGDAEVKGHLQAGRSILIGLASLIEEAVERKIFSTYGSLDSMVNGHGTFLTNKDRFQTTNLQVRGSMTVMDLIVNQLHAMQGDYYFSDVGSIERVVPLDSSNSYRIYLKKETETSVIMKD